MRPSQQDPIEAKGIVAVPFVDVGRFESPSGDLLRLAARLHGQSVLGELHGINAPEAAPEEIVAAFLADELRVDGVEYADRVAAEQRPVVFERTLRAVCRRHADTACFASAPVGHRVVEQVLFFQPVDIGGPESAFGFECGACFLAESRADALPVHQVGGTDDRDAVTVAFRGVEIEAAVVGTDHRRVGHVEIHDRIGVGVLGPDAGRREKNAAENQCFEEFLHRVLFVLLFIG